MFIRSCIIISLFLVVPGTGFATWSIANQTGVNVTDFQLQSGSPAIDNGVNMSGVFTTDFQWGRRGSTFDIGAFEYMSIPNQAIKAPRAPTQFRIQ